MWNFTTIVLTLKESCVQERDRQNETGMIYSSSLLSITAKMFSEVFPVFFRNVKIFSIPGSIRTCYLNIIISQLERTFFAANF